MNEKDKGDFGGVLIDKTTQCTKQDEKFVSVYANNVHLTVSIFDISLTFGEVTDEIQDKKAVVSQKAKVTLSKEMAKVLFLLLESNIKAYEDQFGEIKIPTQKKPTKEQQVLASAARRNKK